MSYSTMTLYTIECDECGATEDTVPRRDVNPKNPLRQARLEMVTVGWAHIRGKDYCPTCKVAHQ